MTKALVKVSPEYSLIRTNRGDRVVVERERVSVVSVGIQGPAGAGIAFVIGETPTGLVNGSNATFQSAYAFVPESVAVFINGLNQAKTQDFTTSGTRTIQMMVSPETGDLVQINYQREA